MNIVIIGNSAASTAVIEAIRHHDKQSTIIQLSDEAFPLYSRCLLSYYIADTIPAETLLYREKDFHQKMGVSLYTGPQYRVTKINVDAHQVICRNGDKFEYDRLVICTGSSPKLPKEIKEGIEGVYVLRNQADSEIIKKKIPFTKHAVIFGGGLIGMKAAFALSTAGLKTTVVVRSGRVLSQMIDEAAGQIILEQLNGYDIDVIFHADIKEIITKDNKLAGIVLDNGKTLDCELLLIAKGVEPNTDIVKNTPIVVNKGIRTNEYLQTNIENIYAAGDVAEAFDIVLEDYTINALWTCAVQQGRIAGLNIAGIQTAYTGALAMNSLNICNTSLISFGITSPKDESQFKILTANNPKTRAYKKIVIGKDNRIKGILLLGKTTNAGVLLSLIQKKLDVSRFEDELLNDGFNFGTLLKYEGKEYEQYYKGI